jgi:NAD(P)H-hydrate epimerase
MDRELTLTREQSRLVDRIAIERYGIPGIVLMENSGRGVVDVLLEIDPELCRWRGLPPAVAILCGKGNNAGDGFVVARHLSIRDVAATAVLLGSPHELTGDALTNYEILARTGAPLVNLSATDPHELPALLDGHAGGATWLVDALLGTGAVGAPREPFRTAIAWMNAHGARRLAIDLPSGLDCDTGAAASETVRADVTCTFVAAKTGFLAPSARPFLGDVHVVSIGAPPGVLAAVRAG